MPEQNNDAQDAPITEENATVAQRGVLDDVARRIIESQNILIALSSNPSVDEMAAAISLSLYLEKIDKNVTAIYSGQTPDALQFLKPEETFEQSADVLQDFVIAISKEKADHLRYKMDGDFVKIYITPYKTKVSESDLDFSYGDFNVDLVLALDVSNGIDLDSALREHGRIMHDAAVVNITTGRPGKFGEIEWSDEKASSISEMIADLLFSMEKPVDSEEATALLTGVVAATNSFSNARTTSETMRISSELMEAGANQQLISMHVSKDTENEMLQKESGVAWAGNDSAEKTEEAGDATQLEIEHDDEPEPTPEPEPVEEPAVEPVEEPVEEPVSEPVFEPEPVVEPVAEPANEPAPEPISEPTPEPEPVAAPEVLPEPSYMETGPASSSFSDETQALQSEVLDQLNGADLENPDGADSLAPRTETVLQPSEEPLTFEEPNDDSKYSQMLEDALNETNAAMNPATATAQTIEAPAEINGVPVINYAQTDDILPPPPMPPVNLDEAVAAAPVIEPEPMVEPQPVAPMTDPYAMQPVAEPVVSEMQAIPEQPIVEPQPVAPQPTGQTYAAPSPDDVSAFKIPGM